MGERLRQLRLEKGVSQKVVAQSIGVAMATYAHYEQGLREPNCDMIVKLCKFYGVTSDYLLGLSDF